MVRVADLRTARTRDLVPSAGSHRAPSLGKGAWPVVCLSTDPGDGGPPVAERPVELGPGGRIRDLGLPGGSYGPPSLLREVRQFFVTSTEDLDGTNASGRDALFLVRYRP